MVLALQSEADCRRSLKGIEGFKRVHTGMIKLDKGGRV